MLKCLGKLQNEPCLSLRVDEVTEASPKFVSLVKDAISTHEQAQTKSVQFPNHYPTNPEAKVFNPVSEKPLHKLQSAIKTVGSAAVVGTDPGVASVVTASTGPAAVAEGSTQTLGVNSPTS